MSYTFTALNEIKPEMVAEATKDARASAQQFAKDSGSAVGKDPRRDARAISRSRRATGRLAAGAWPTARTRKCGSSPRSASSLD